MNPAEPSRSSRPVWLADFIRQNQDAILADWVTAIHALPIARDLPRPTLLDHLPKLLEHIATTAEQDDGTGRPSMPAPASTAHALERLEEGFDLGEVVTEYAVLRDCVLRQWERPGVRAVAPAELRVLNRAIDYAISISITRFTTVRDRTLRALDRVSAAALGTDSLDTFLPALLLVLKETTPAVHWATILLREGDTLVVRASVGLEEAAARRDTVPFGRDFAGLVAREARTLFTSAASEDPRVASAAIRAVGTRALLGVPLVHEAQVVGVVEFGSRTAGDFSDEDRLLFNVLATRATAMIEQHRLRDLAEQRAAEAQRAVRARDEVLSIVSHDLRNPLSVIVTASTLLHQAAENPTQVRSKTAVIQRAAARMTRLLGDLLDVSRLEAGGLVLERTPCGVVTLVQEALNQQRPLAEEQGVHLVSDLATGLPPVLADRDRLLRVFANLLGNALKFTPRGGTITIRAAAVGAFVHFAVEDTGAGISPEHLPHLFERFRQANAGAREGVGLGLAIVKGLVEAHEGRVWVESQVGIGSTFLFTVPVAAP